MHNQKRIMTIILCACMLLTGCANASAATGVQESGAEQKIALPNNWEPTLEVEQASPTGATFVVQAVSRSDGFVVLCGNDYFLETYTADGWASLPMLEDKVTFVKDAFAVTAVPRDDVDWEWLYGSLPNGYYRIGKSVTLQRDGENLETSTIYGEFLLKVADPEDAGSVYDAGAAVASVPVYLYTPLEALPKNYDFAQAENDHVVVMDDSAILANREVWRDFVSGSTAGQALTVRCMVMDSAGKTQEIYDVTYNGLHYTLRWPENGVEHTILFKHLLHYEDATADRYVLTSDKNVTWEDIQWGIESSDPNDAVAHKVVIQELRHG